MQRQVERERVLPAFSLGLGDFEVLIKRLLALFDAEDVYVSINITLKGEELTFKSVEEIKEYAALKGTVGTFSIWISAGNKRISLRSRLLFGQMPTISAVADSEAWCAGATETAYSFLVAYRRWYSWFIAAPIGWLLLILGNTPIVAILVLPKGTPVPKPILIAWLAAVLVLIVLFISRSTLLPAATLRITEEDSFVNKHAAELSLVIALVSALLTAIGWLVSQ